MRSRAELVAYTARLRPLGHEELWAFAIDDAGRLRAEVRLRGHATGVVARPADLLGAVLAAGVRRLALVHNHPSGDPRPSALDVAFTARVAAAAALLGVTLCDHVVVAQGGWRAIPHRGNAPSLASASEPG